VGRASTIFSTTLWKLLNSLLLPPPLWFSTNVSSSPVVIAGFVVDAM
jgi:hypothetical protein